MLKNTENKQQTTHEFTEEEIQGLLEIIRDDERTQTLQTFVIAFLGAMFIVVLALVIFEFN